MPNLRRVMSIPELASTITGLLDSTDLYCLLRVSRPFFYSTAPMLWKEVPRLDVLLLLIPETTVRRGWKREMGGDNFRQVDIILPESLDFTRFNIYAPWVRQLELFTELTKYKVTNSSELMRAASDRLLLPGLRSLSLSADIETSSEDFVWFTELFLCPTLIEIRHVSDCSLENYMQVASAYPLAQKISIVCPGLQTLEFYPYRHDFEDEEWAHLVRSLDLGFPLILAGFSNLRSFSSTAFVFEPPVFEVLGSLPLLESLGIVDSRADEETPPILSTDFQIPATWFPALRNLRIYYLHPRDIFVMWHQPPLIQNLVSAIVKCYPSTPDGEMDSEEGSEEGESDPDGQEWIDKFLNVVPRSSPHIRELELEFDTFSWDSQTYSLLEARDHLRRLPLDSIKFNGHEFVL